MEQHPLETRLEYVRRVALTDAAAKVRALKGSPPAETVGELVLVATWNDALEAAAKTIETV